MIEISDDKKLLILQEIKDYYNGNERQPGDVTVSEVAEQLGVVEETARSVLGELVQAGRFERLPVGRNKRGPFVYRKVEQDTEHTA